MNCAFFFLIISRDENCLPGQPKKTLLDTLSKKDAETFIENEFKTKNYKPESEEIKKLADHLQYFPLDLKVAITCINENRDITHYINYGEHQKKHLEAALQVTIETIKKRGNDGENALKILGKIVPDENNEIHYKTLLSQFKNDKKIIANGILLLKRYSVITQITNGVCKINSLCKAIVGLESTSVQENVTPNLQEN